MNIDPKKVIKTKPRMEKTLGFDDSAFSIIAILVAICFAAIFTRK